jgi:hypothetical protein
LTVEGAVDFAPGVVVEGDVTFRNPGGDPWTVRAGVYRDETVEP